LNIFDGNKRCVRDFQMNCRGGCKLDGIAATHLGPMAYHEVDGERLVAFAGGGNRNNANHHAYFIVLRLDFETPDRLTARVARIIAFLRERYEGVDFTSHTAPKSTPRRRWSQLRD
jgi:hypothetical protein